MRTITVPIYTFAELSPEAKEDEARNAYKYPDSLAESITELRDILESHGIEINY
jgi:hypothetical protein